MHAAKKSTSLSVLVVDDEPLIRWSIGETLTHEGHSVAVAADGKEALRRLEESPLPDVILLDYRLPDSNDLGLLEAVRRAAPGSAVIMMTAFGTPAVQAGALALGAFRVVGKPIEMHDLEPLVQQAHQSRA